MYIIGGFTGEGVLTMRVSRFDCFSHTFDRLPNMLRARAQVAAGVIDGKIYVIGGFRKDSKCNDWVEVFDFETQAWSFVIGPYAPESDEEFLKYLVRREIYIMAPQRCYSYEPRQNLWEPWENLIPFRSLWPHCSCVVDDRFYCLGRMLRFRFPLLVYDEVVKEWITVGGVNLSSLDIFYQGSKMANLGGKLVILGLSLDVSHDPVYYKVCLVEITLERRENGSISGNVESIKPVLLSRDWPAIELCLTVTV